MSIDNKTYRYRGREADTRLKLVAVIEGAKTPLIFMDNKGELRIRFANGWAYSEEQGHSASDIIPCPEKVTVHLYRDRESGKIHCSTIRTEQKDLCYSDYLGCKEIEV